MLLLKLFWVFAKIGIFTVGGGYAMIPFVQKEAVEINKWVSKEEFLEILSLDTVTPGPLAVNLSTFVGYKVNGIVGALVATLGVILPSIVIVILVAAFFYAFRTNKIVQAVLQGLKPAVVALIAVGIFSLIQGKAIIDFRGIIILVVVFVGVAVFKIHPIWLVVASGLAGIVFYLR
ncbi:chromate transporter [Patescibacteria group bacterium]